MKRGTTNIIKQTTETVKKEIPNTAVVLKNTILTNNKEEEKNSVSGTVESTHEVKGLHSFLTKSKLLILNRTKSKKNESINHGDIESKFEPQYQNFISEQNIIERFENLNYSDYFKDHTEEEIIKAKNSRIELLLELRKICIEQRDIRQTIGILSKFLDPEEKESGFFYGFCVDLTNEILIKGYNFRVIKNKISAFEMYDLILKHNNQENRLLNQNTNISMEKDKGMSESNQSFQRVLEIKDANFLAEKNLDCEIHLTFDKNLEKILKEKGIEGYEIVGDRSNKVFDILMINHEKKTVFLKDSKSVDLYKAANQIKKGYLDCIYGIGMSDEIKQERVITDAKISPEIFKQLVNTNNKRPEIVKSLSDSLQQDGD